MSDSRLLAIRDLIQQDPGNRGLRTDPAENLVTCCAGDFEAACRSIAETPNPSLAVVTGFYIAHAEPPCAETDGPLGAVFLARALVPLGVRMMILTDRYCQDALRTGLELCGLPPSGDARQQLNAFREWFTRQQPTPQVVPVFPLPPPDQWPEEGPEVYGRFVEAFGSTHLIALERAGPSRLDGRCYSMRGRDITQYTAPTHLFFEQTAGRPGLTSIGIGDGGNEIGMGKVAWEVIRRNIPNGQQIACRVATDHLIVAGVSNWGAYGLAAGVRLLRGAPHEPDLFDPQHEQKLLQWMVEQGPLVDGVSGRREAAVDGLPFDRYAQVLSEIGNILR
jgi:hypothetical protein